MAIVTGKDGFVYSKFATTAMAAEPMTSSPGNIYQVTSSLHTLIDPNVAVALNTTALSYLDATYGFGGYDYFNGKVHLSTATTPTITGNWLSLTSLVDILNWSMDLRLDTAEDTSLGDTWKTHTVLQKGYTVSIKRWFSTTDLTAVALASSPLILKLFYSATAGIWLYGYIQGMTNTIQKGAIQDETVTFIGHGYTMNF